MVVASKLVIASGSGLIFHLKLIYESSNSIKTSHHIITASTVLLVICLLVQEYCASVISTDIRY